MLVEALEINIRKKRVPVAGKWTTRIPKPFAPILRQAQHDGKLK